ncbi:MAG: hypothetical protein QOH05_3256 [Acetobacteraceae bacterium]|jgi:uncharacterized protein (DUF1499 family)|nr:hypothetical protein [Acetobacteraceae bacterium]
MNPLAWLIGLALPACGFSAADGLPTPSLMEITHIVRPATPNTALAGPAGSTPAPDVVTPPYKLSADALFALIQQVANSQPRTYQAALFPGQLQAHYVARSALLNFPDLIMVQVRKDSPDRSELIVYSRSVYGRSDFGVNRKRVETWLAALQMKLPPSSER